MVKPLKRVKCTVMYHGAHYNGWQVQNNVVSVQGLLETILKTMHQRDVQVIGSGRTDAKVHALGQVFHFDSELELNEAEWLKAFNRQLPMDIKVIEVQFVSKQFHARYSVIRKQYEYLIYQGSIQPFNYETHACIEPFLNRENMRKAMSVFIGTHDFSAFCANNFTEMPNQVRTILRFELYEEEDVLRFVIEGDGFMRYMIRMIMACIIDIGKGRLRISDAKRILDSRDKTAYSGMAEACGLYLTEVEYPEGS